MAELKLIDFDWNLEFVMGSSAVSTVDQPLLHLHLDVGTATASNSATSASSGTRPISDGAISAPNGTAHIPAPLDIELDRSQLKSLISQLEVALSG